jgi:hypothetical protein
MVSTANTHASRTIPCRSRPFASLALSLRVLCMSTINNTKVRIQLNTLAPISHRLQYTLALYPLITLHSTVWTCPPLPCRDCYWHAARIPHTVAPRALCNSPKWVSYTFFLTVNRYESNFKSTTCRQVLHTPHQIPAHSPVHGHGAVNGLNYPPDFTSLCG